MNTTQLTVSFFSDTVLLQAVGPDVVRQVLTYFTKGKSTGVVGRYKGKMF